MSPLICLFWVGLFTLLNVGGAYCIYQWMEIAKDAAKLSRESSQRALDAYNRMIVATRSINQDN